jgi:Peptidase inhibitor family I36
VPSVPSTTLSSRPTGYYSYTQPDGQQAVAYVVAAGQWDAAPVEIKQLPLAANLMPIEKSSKWMVIYGPNALADGPWAPQANASSARTTTRDGVKAHAAAASDCVSPWFCVFTDGSFGGTKCQWQSTGVWQSMAGTSCNLAGSSMVNRRTGWSLLKRTDGANYCAVPGSQDASLGSNGFNDNTYETYNSTATTKQSAWNCVN